MAPPPAESPDARARRERLVPLLLLLSATTGLVDAVSVLGLNKVFTANMTGNVVFLAFAAARAPGFTTAPYLIAILCFLLGATAAGRTARRHQERPLARWLVTAALVEATLLGAAAVSLVGYDVEALAPKAGFYAAIALTAMAMGFRNATVSKLKVEDLTTTVLTLTLTGLAADSGPADGENRHWRRRVLGVLVTFAGAAAGAVLLVRHGPSLPLIVGGALSLAGTLVWAGARRGESTP